MTTGFETYAIICIVMLAIFALAWRALGRHVTVNNHNAPTATANATSEAPAPASLKRNLAGGLLSVAIVAAVVLLVGTMLGTQIAAPAKQPAVVPQAAPVAIPIEIEAEYTPVQLPRYESATDLGQIAGLAFVLCVLGAILWAVSRRTPKAQAAPPAVRRGSRITKIERVDGLQADLFTQAAKKLNALKK